MALNAEGLLRAATLVEAALERESAEPGIPTSLAERYRAGVRLLRQAADADVAEDDARRDLQVGLDHLQVPPGLSLPHQLILDLETARFAVNGALRDD